MIELERLELQPGGVAFSRWLSEWQERALEATGRGRRIVVLVNYPVATHVRVVELERGESWQEALADG